MLDASLKVQLTEIFSNLQANYVFNVKVRADHEYRTDLLSILEETASCSEKISCEVEDGDGLEFLILKDGIDIGICFHAVPNGHEFSSLLLAVLNADGKGNNLPDEATKERLMRLRGDINITTYMSLTCTNCPDVVQALNLMAILNTNIHHIVRDGALYQDETDRLKIKVVPAVLVDDEIIHIGRSSFGELLDKLEERFGEERNESETQIRYFDLIVAGGGPAGVAAAIYSARKGLKVAIVADRIGGQVNDTIGIENIISIPYTTGPSLANNLRKHLKSYDIAILDNRNITAFSLEGKDKILKLSSGEILQTQFLIIATGASWRKLNVPGEAEYIGKGVAFCPHCDGPYYKGKKVAVIGGGNSGIEAAIDLAGICAEVTVFEFMESLKADIVLQEKLRKLPNVRVFTNKQVLEVLGDSSNMTAIKIKDRVSDEISEYPINGVFVQIGLSANSNLFKEVLDINAMGEIITDKDCRSSLPGIYAAGDVSNVSYKQIIISMGEGAKAALSAFDDKIRGTI